MYYVIVLTGDLAVLVKGVNIPLNIDIFDLETYMLLIQLNQAFYQKVVLKGNVEYTY